MPLGALALLAGCAAAPAAPPAASPAAPLAFTAPAATVAARGGAWPTRICPREPIALATNAPVTSNAGVFVRGYFVPNPSFLKTAATPFELTIGGVTRRYTPDYGCITGLGGVGERGGPGASGGSRLYDASGGSDEDAGGDRGGAGGVGGVGPNLRVFATMVKTPFYPRVVALTVEGDRNDFLLVPVGAPITVRARGGDGGVGGRGGAGMPGRDGGPSKGRPRSGLEALLSDQDRRDRADTRAAGAPPPKATRAARGGTMTAPASTAPTGLGARERAAERNHVSGYDGGNGGEGGPGGEGGEGGTVVVYVDRRFPEIARQIMLDVGGGAGGPGGPGGAPGLGGFQFRGRDVELGGDPTAFGAAHDGANGEAGPTGPRGKDGAPGHAEIVLDDLAIAPLPGIEML